jgi:hypothetical protein
MTLNSVLPENLADLSKEQLLGLKTTIEEELDTLALQMREARANRATRKEWVLQAERSLRIKKRQVQRLQHEMTRRNQAVTTRVRWENLFIAAARDVLPPDVFETVKNAAKQRQKDIAA